MALKNCIGIILQKYANNKISGVKKNKYKNQYKPNIHYYSYLFAQWKL